MKVFKNKTKKFSKIKNLKKLLFIVVIFLGLSISIIFYGSFLSNKYLNLTNNLSKNSYSNLNEIKIHNCNDLDIYLSKNKTSKEYIIIYIDFSSNYNKKFLKTFKIIEKEFINTNNSKINVVIRPINTNPNSFNLNKEFYLVLKALELQNLTDRNLAIIEYFLNEKIKDKNKLYSYVYNLEGFNKDKFYKDINNKSLISYYEVYSKEETVEVSPTIIINGKIYEGIKDIKTIKKLLNEKN